jgi:hypothetical protein
MKAVLFGIVLLFTACECTSSDDKKLQYKYQLGDVVLVKPDSMKATISGRYYYGADGNGDNGIRYEIQYYDKDGDQKGDYVKEFQIFGKQKNY